MPCIFTVTFNPCIDTHTSVSKLQPDVKLPCAAPLVQPGGGGINVARAILRLGGHADAIFPCGGEHCRTLKVLLACEKVGYIAVGINGETRQNMIVRDRSSGLQYKFNMPGPRLDEEAVQGILTALREQESVRYIVVSGSLPAGVSPDIFREIRSIATLRNALLIVDTSGEALKGAVAAGADLVKLSLHELAAFADGRPLMTIDEIETTAAEILDSGVATVVISMGERGALWVTRTGKGLIPSLQLKTQSTVGAGDSMLAGIVLQLSMGSSIDEAVEYGVACGTAATLQPGTTLCNRNDIVSILAGMRDMSNAAFSY